MAVIREAGVNDRSDVITVERDGTGIAPVNHTTVCIVFTETTEKCSMEDCEEGIDRLIHFTVPDWHPCDTQRIVHVERWLCSKHSLPFIMRASKLYYEVFYSV